MDRVPIAAFPFDVRPGEVERNLAAATDGLERAGAAGARLLVLPEKWTTSHLPHYGADVRAASDEALARLHARAVELAVTVIGSALGGGGEKPFNEQHVLGASGDLRPYRKRILFRPMGEDASCMPSNDLPRAVTTPAGSTVAVICYDLRFPEITRHAFYQGADLLVVPAEWPSVRSSILELLARARAAENQCWLVSCNRAGSVAFDGRDVPFPGSALLVDPLGAVVARSDGGELLLSELDPALTRDVRRTIPCALDLERSGLELPSPPPLGGAPSA
jgi:predicted amidohydrolase